MSEATFPYDVFLSHSAKDKAVVQVPSLSASNGERAGVRCRCLRVAERLRQHISTLLPFAFCLLPFPRAPLNQESRFIPLRLDDAPIKGSLAQFLYINWHPANREREHAKLSGGGLMPAS